MLDLELVNRIMCYRFVTCKPIRELFFVMRKKPEKYIPRSITLSVKKPIISLLGGVLKVTPICFGNYHTTTANIINSMRTAVVLNYYSEAIVGKSLHLDNKLYIESTLGQIAISAVVSAGINAITLIGNEIPLLINTAGFKTGVVEAVNASTREVKRYLDLYRNNANPNYKTQPGMQCMLCDKRKKCS